MRAFMVLFAGLLLVPCAIATTPDSALVLDQSLERFDGYSSPAVTDKLAQTFTVGLAGELRRVEVPLWHAHEEVTTEVSVSIVKVHAGLPGVLPEDTLATTRVDIVDPNYEVYTGIPFSPFYWVPASFPGITVGQGDELGILISSTGQNGFYWAVGFPGRYSGGGAFIAFPDRIEALNRVVNRPEPVDYSFRTFVAPIPEPTTLLCALFGICSVCSLRRRGGS